MFSFVGDTVLDPFCGTGTTMVAAMKSARNSIAAETDTTYRRCYRAASRFMLDNSSLFSRATLQVEMRGNDRIPETHRDYALQGASDPNRPPRAKGRTKHRKPLR